MANHSDHLEEQDQSRPFLASTEAHQATLMREVKGGHALPATDADEPAPMLPPIVNHPIEDSPISDTSPIDPIPDVASAAPSHPNQEVRPPSQAEDHDINYAAANSGYPNSRRVVAGMATALIAIAGFSAAWYNVNQDIYTLGSSESSPDNTKQAANKPPSPQAVQPSTLGAETGAAQAATVTLNHLPALEQGQYHLWLKQGDVTTSLGQFSVNDQGQAINPDQQLFQPQIKGVTNSTSLLLSIETTANPSQPSSTIILSGQFKDGQAKLSFSAIDLAQASGVYTIAAPTDLSGDYQSSGIWLAKTDGHTLTGPGLQVPAAPTGWKYETQLAYKDQIIAAGRFSNPSDRDDFGVFTPNPDRTPNFPGEDYIQGAPSRLGVDFPANLTSGDWKVIVSIEPDLNGSDPTGDGTFFLQPFTATIAQGTENYTEQSLSLDTSKFPTMTISVK